MKENYIKVLLLSAVFFMYINTSIAQSSIAIDASQVISTFSFEDNTGAKDKEYNASYSGAYSLGYKYAHESGIIGLASLGMQKRGATLIYDAINYSWDLQYANIKIGAGYAYNMGRLSPYLTVSPYLGYLLKANQRINNEDIDIIDSGSIEKIDFGVGTAIGANFKISDDISTYVEYGYTMGLKNIETSENGQKASNRASLLTLGLAFSITSLK